MVVRWNNDRGNAPLLGWCMEVRNKKDDTDRNAWDYQMWKHDPPKTYANC